MAPALSRGDGRPCRSRKLASRRSRPLRDSLRLDSARLVHLSQSRVEDRSPSPGNVDLVVSASLWRLDSFTRRNRRGEFCTKGPPDRFIFVHDPSGLSSAPTPSPFLGHPPFTFPPPAGDGRRTHTHVQSTPAFSSRPHPFLGPSTPSPSPVVPPLHTHSPLPRIFSATSGRPALRSGKLARGQQQLVCI